MKKLLVIILAVFFITACGNDVSDTKVEKFKDGVYTAESEPDEWGGKVSVELKIEDGKIISCDMKNLDNEGKEKDEDYGKKDGKIDNPGLYKIAQNAVELAKQYPDELIDSQDIDQVEVLSGATVSYNGFKQAVEKALEESIK